MFTLKELEEDPTAILDLKEDIREECEKLGDVTNVVLYDKEEDGIVSIRFANAESAKACVSVCSAPIRRLIYKLIELMIWGIGYGWPVFRGAEGRSLYL